VRTLRLGFRAAAGGQVELSYPPPGRGRRKR
jgi:hypothetical protein